jgi:hypothetical protein
MKKEIKDSSSIFYNQATTTTNTTPGAVSCHCYCEEYLLSMPSLSKCNHKYFSGIAQSSKLICDSCNEIIGEWKFSLFSYNAKNNLPRPQYLIYKIYPYLRGLTVEEIQELI